MKVLARFLRLTGATLLTLLGMLVAVSATASELKLTDLIGHPVETDSGDKLGSVEDFSFDPDTGSLQFVVISIGSFLVENSLIAVEPAAIANISNGDPIVLRMEDLEVAHRFNADSWPDSADVRSVTHSQASENGESGGSSGGEPDGSSAGEPSTLSSTGTATITSGSKKATYKNGKRELVNGPIRGASLASNTPPKRTPARRVDRVVPNFKNLDSNKDGRLSPSEIGAQLNKRSGFGELDADANGAIDDFEYEAYRQRKATQIRRSWGG